jgi:hypothetical protein
VCKLVSFYAYIDLRFEKDEGEEEIERGSCLVWNRRDVEPGNYCKLSFKGACSAWKIPSTTDVLELSFDIIANVHTV